MSHLPEDLRERIDFWIIKCQERLWPKLQLFLSKFVKINRDYLFHPQAVVETIQLNVEEAFIGYKGKNELLEPGLCQICKSYYNLHNNISNAAIGELLNYLSDECTNKLLNLDDIQKRIGHWTGEDNDVPDQVYNYFDHSIIASTFKLLNEDATLQLLKTTLDDQLVLLKFILQDIRDNKSNSNKINDKEAEEKTHNALGAAHEEDIPVGIWDDLKTSFYVHKDISDGDFVLWVKSFNRDEKLRKVKESAKRNGKMLPSTTVERAQIKYTWDDYGKSKVWVENRYRTADYLKAQITSGKLDDKVNEARLCRALNHLLKNAQGFLEQYTADISQS